MNDERERINQYSSGPGGSFTYDDNGNLTYYGQTSGWERYFTYDAENQLLSVQVPGYFYSTFTYDGRGRRRQRSVQWLVQVRRKEVLDSWLACV